MKLILTSLVLGFVVACSPPPEGATMGECPTPGTACTAGATASCTEEFFCPTAHAPQTGTTVCSCTSGQWSCDDQAMHCPDVPDAGPTDESPGCPFQPFTRDYPAPDGGTVGDSGLDCRTICPDAPLISAGPPVTLGCSIVASDGGAALRCEYTYTCI